MVLVMHRSWLRTLGDLFNVLPCEHVVVAQPAPFDLPGLPQMLGDFPTTNGTILLSFRSHLTRIFAMTFCRTS